MPAPATLPGFEGEDRSESNFEETSASSSSQFASFCIGTFPNMLHSVQVEGTFPDGTKLITVHDAIACENGDLQLALHGSFLPIPSIDKFPRIEEAEFSGEIIYGDGSITLNPRRKAVILKVVNTGDRLVQVGSHYHFIETNPYLLFDQLKALGMRVNIPAGTATQFQIALYSI